MTTDYLVGLIKQKQSKCAMTDDDILDTLRKTIKITLYIPYFQKVQTIKQIVRQSCIGDDDALYLDNTILQYNFVSKMLEMYTDIDVQDDTFDKLTKSAILKYILGLFADEYQLCESILDIVLCDLYRGVITNGELLRAN